jgi:hypothetical protein
MQVSGIQPRPAPAARRHRPSEPQQCEESPRCAELQREVAELRAEVEELRQDQSPIRMDPQNDKLSIVDLKTPDFHVHELDLKMSSMSEMFEEHTSLEALLKAGMGEAAEPIDFSKMRGEPMEIEKMKISMPGSTLVRSSEQVGSDSLKKNDIKDLSIEPKDGNILKIKGKVDKLIDIPFDLEGKLSVQDGNRIEFALGKTRVFGVLPIFGLVKRIGAAIAGKNMEDMGVERRGTSFIMDADDFLPENTKVRLTKVGTEGDRLVLEGASPKKEEPPQPERAPSTLTLGIA